jgi:hypothetical protein
MEKIAIAFAISIFFLFGIAQAQEEAPKCNFGTLKAGVGGLMAPGEKWEAPIFFFNQGNRVTHVRLYVIEKPEGWNVTIDPPLEKKKYLVHGEEREVEENICVNPPGLQACRRPDGSYYPPGDPVDEPPEELPEGIDYHLMMGKYYPVRVATVTAKIPEDAEIGKSYGILVQAFATCLGPAGMITLEQTRTFDYTLRLIQREYAEEAIIETPAPTPTATLPTEATSETQTIIIQKEMEIPPWVYLIIALLVIIVILQFVLQRRK